MKYRRIILFSVGFPFLNGCGLTFATARSGCTFQEVPRLTIMRLDLAAEFSLYVLSCKGDCYYVGIAPADEIGERIRKQFAGQGAHFCQVNKPQKVVCVWPAACGSFFFIVKPQC